MYGPTAAGDLEATSRRRPWPAADRRRRPADAVGAPSHADAAPTRALPPERVRVSGELRTLTTATSCFGPHAVKQVFVQESQLRKKEKCAPVSLLVSLVSRPRINIGRN